MRAVAVLALLALASCKGNVTPEAADGYRFGVAEYDMPGVHITFVEHENAEYLIAAAPKATRDAVNAEGRILAAWSEISANGENCTVHIIDPDRDYQPEWIGHEVTHCIKGRWHS